MRGRARSIASQSLRSRPGPQNQRASRGMIAHGSSDPRKSDNRKRTGSGRSSSRRCSEGCLHAPAIGVRHALVRQTFGEKEGYPGKRPRQRNERFFAVCGLEFSRPVSKRFQRRWIKAFLGFLDDVLAKKVPTDKMAAGQRLAVFGVVAFVHPAGFLKVREEQSLGFKGEFPRL